MRLSALPCSGVLELCRPSVAHLKTVRGLAAGAAGDYNATTSFYSASEGRVNPIPGRVLSQFCPIPRRPAARVSGCSPRTAGPQPCDVPRLALLLRSAAFGREGDRVRPAGGCPPAPARNRRDRLRSAYAGRSAARRWDSSTSADSLRAAPPE